MEATLQVTTVNPSEFGLNIETASSITKDLPAILHEREPLAQQYSEIITMDIEDAATAKRAKEVRLKIKNNRTKGIEAWHKVNKEFFLKGGQFIDAIKRKESAENERMEQVLEEIEKHQENLEKQRIEKLHTERVELISGYVEDVTGLKLGEMEEDVWEAYLSAKITAHNQRIAAEKQVEEERIAKEKAESEERERIRLENERLKKEAEEKELLLTAERAKVEEERKAAEAKAKLEREAIEQKAAEERKLQEEALRKEREEKEKLEMALREKARLEAEQERQRLEEEERKQKEAAALAKAPIKKQLKSWANEFALPATMVESDVRKEIETKFEGFKKWANELIEKI